MSSNKFVATGNEETLNADVTVGRASRKDAHREQVTSPTPDNKKGVLYKLTDLDYRPKNGVPYTFTGSADQIMAYVNKIVKDLPDNRFRAAVELALSRMTGYDRELDISINTRSSLQAVGIYVKEVE